MSISVLAQGNVLSNMRALFALLMAEAATLDPMGGKLLRLVRSIARLMRAIIHAEVIIYQSRMISNMLSDPAWRARVIAGFGGYTGLYEWQRRHKFADLKKQKCRDGMGAAPRDMSLSSRPSRPTAKRESRALSDPIFVLPPVPRAFFGRAQRTDCLLYTSPSPRDRQKSRMPSSA